MTLHQLEIFAAVARHGNITKASEELHIAQPSVSRQLRMLEEDCNVKLYRKVDRGIELTEEGRLFLSDTAPILTQIQKLKEKFNYSSIEQKNASLKIGGSHSQSVSFLPLPIAAFKENHPEVEVTLHTDRSRVIEQMVLDAQVEIGLITNPSGACQLSYEPYRQEKVVFFVSRQHPLAHKKDLGLEDLSTVPLVFRVAKHGQVGPMEQFLNELKKEGVRLTGALRCESPSAVKTVVKTGMGVGILYEGDYVGAPGDHEIADCGLKLLRIPKMKKHVETFIIYRKHKSLSPPAQEFLALLHQWPQKTPCVARLPRAS